MSLSISDRIRYTNLLDEARQTANAERAEECLREALLILEGDRLKLMPEHR